MNAHKIVDILLEGEDEDFDAYFMAATSPKEAYALAQYSPELRPGLERVIATSAAYSYMYARHVLKGQFPAGEPAIATNAGLSYEYARYCLKGKPFPLAEPAIAEDAMYSCMYAQHVLKGPFPAGEPAIATDGDCVRDYNKRFGTNI